MGLSTLEGNGYRTVFVDWLDGVGMVSGVEATVYGDNDGGAVAVGAGVGGVGAKVGVEDADDGG
jgi:hypothetical protein